MAISDTIDISVSGIGEVSALADALDKAAQAAARLDELAGKGISFSGAAAGLGEMEKSLGRLQAQADALNKSLADIGKGGAGGDAAAASLAKIADAEKAAAAQADAMAASVGKADDTLKGLGGSADASAAGLGKLSDAQKSAAETGAGLRDTTAGVSEGLKVQADQTAALTALQAEMADSQKALTALSAEHAAVVADSNAKIATGQRLNTAASRDAAAGAAAAQAEQSKAARQAAADTEASAGKYHMLALGSAAVLAYGIDKAAQLQTSVTRLYTTAGESEKNLPMMSAGILALSGQTNTSQAQLGQGAYMVESAGYHGQDALGVLKAAAEGAQAEGAPLGDTANALTSLMNAYGVPKGKTASQAAMSDMDQIIAMVSRGKMTMAGAVGALPDVLPAASAAKLSFADVGGALATQTSLGVSPDRAAQNLSHVITSLMSPNAVQTKEQQQLGLNPVQLQNDLGKQGLTGTLTELSSTVMKQMGPAGDVLFKTFNQSRSAAADAQTMIGAMPSSIRGVAQAYADGKTTVAQWNAEMFKGSESSVQKNMLQQFATVENQAKGFNDLLKTGAPDVQTYAAAMSKLLGGQTGLNVAMELTGQHMPVMKANTDAIAASAQHAGDNVTGWAKVQGTLNFQLGSAVKNLQAVATEAGQVALPAITGVLHGAGDVLGFASSHKTLTQDAMLGAGALALPALLAKVASPVATGLGAVGKVAETLKIPGLDKLAGLGNIGKNAGLDTAASGLSGAAGSLDGAAGSLEGAAASLRAGSLPGGKPGEPGVNEPLPGGKPGDEPGAVPVPGRRGEKPPSEEVPKEKVPPERAPSSTGDRFRTGAAGIIGSFLFVDPLLANTPSGPGGKNWFDSPFGMPGPKDPASKNNWLTSFAPYENLFTHTGGAPAPPAGIQAAERAGASVAGRFGPDTAPVAVAAPQQAVVQPAAPADLLGGAGHPGTVTIKPKITPPDMSGFSAMLSSAMHLAPLKIPAPDTSALKSAAAQAQSALTAMEAVHPKPIKIPSPDLSALKSAAGAASAAGASAGAGFAAGIAGETGAVTAAASALAAAAAGAMRAGLKSQSPSKVTEKIGQDFTAGFSQGVAGDVTSVKAASASIGSQSVASLLQGLAGGSSNVQAAIQAVMGAASNPGAVDTIRQTFATLIGDVPAKDTALVRYLNVQQGKLSALANQQGKLMSEISNAQQIATSQTGNASITGAGGYVPALAASYGPLAAQSTLTGLGQMAADQKQYASVLAGLKKAGLNATSLSQFAQEGAAQGLPQALGLLQGGKGSVTQANAYEAQIIKASQGIGSTGGTAMYGAQQTLMSGLDAGLKKQLTTLDTVMSKEAQAVITHVEKALGTKAAASTSSSSAASPAAGSTAAGTAATAAAVKGASAAAADLGKVGTAGGAAAAGLNAVAGAAGSAAAGLGKISSALAPLLAASPPPGRAQPLGGGGYSGGGGGGGSVTHVHNTTVHVHGTLVQQQDLADHIQAVTLQKGSNNWQQGNVYAGRAP